MEWVLTLSQTVTGHYVPDKVVLMSSNREDLATVMDAVLAVNPNVGLHLAKEENDN